MKREMDAAASSARLGGNEHGNSSQDNHLRSVDQDSKGPIDALPVPNTEQAMEKGENPQAIHDSEQMEKKTRATERMVAWFSEAGIPFNTACIESFDLMVEAIAQCGPGVQVPSLREVGGPLLQRQILAMNGSIYELKKSWVSEGCSILAYTHINDDGRRMLSLAVDCSHGVAFLRAIELPSDSYSKAFVCQLVDSCIEEVGEKNVVQVIADIPLEMAARKMPRKRPNIFWTHCAARSIDMMLEDIGQIPLIKETFGKATSLTAFIYAETNLLDMVHQFTNQQDLVHAGITIYTTFYLNLRSLYDKRIELKTMFISKEWEDNKWSKDAVGKKYYDLVVSNEFWHNVLYAINSFEPLVEVLRMMGSDRPSMGYIYGELMKAKREITIRFEHKEEHYLPIWHLIDSRMEDYLMKPLHLAGYFLNPWFYYQERHKFDSPIFRDAVFECIWQMYQDKSTQNKIVHQLCLYTTDSESFGTVHAISTRMSVDPVSWWQSHAGTAKELSTMVLRILRLTCGSLAYEPSWIEMIHKEKPSWIKKKQFEDSMFVTVNRRIQGKAQMRDRDPVLAYLSCDDEPFEWLVGMFRLQTQDVRDLLLARASGDGVGLSKLADELLMDAEYVSSEEESDEDSPTSEEESDEEASTSEEESDEEAPTHSIKRKTLSGASCSKQEKRPRPPRPVKKEI